MIEALWKSGHVQDGTLTLTEEGRQRIRRLLIKHRNRLPDPSAAGEVLPFKVHVAPMGSGNQVIEDPKVWDSITESMRKTLGVEMEAAAIGAVVHSQRDKRLEAVVMKGVMDFANQGRDDHFKRFAARASAECLLAFLREQLEVEPIPGVDDILVPGTAPLPENPPPSALLNALHTVIPFHEQGREEILAELTRWRDEGPPVAVRLLHAEGGVGKTRLAIEWIGRQPQGWAAGFLAKQTDADWFEKLWARGQPVLVVIDYAESHSELREVLLRVLRYAQQAGSGSARRMRLLMLARNAGDWWQSLLQSDTALGQWLVATPPYELMPLAPQVAERERVFHEAAERFAEERKVAYQRRAVGPFTDARFERVLYLHMAALAAVEGLDFAAQTLMEVVLNHEERFWETRAKLDDVSRSFQKSKARQLVAAATLRGGLSDFDTAVSVAGQLFRADTLSEDDKRLLQLLQRIYQRPSTSLPMFLPALEPDLLGEGMVLRVASPKQEADRLPPDWMTRVVPPTEDAGVVGTGFEVLGRASAVSAEAVKPWIEHLLAGSLHQRAGLALVAAKAVGLRTAFSVLGDVLADQLEKQGDARLAHELDVAGLPEATVSLRRVAEWVTRTLLRALGVSAEDVVLAERARHQNNLGWRLSELGRRQEALEAAKEAVTLRRELAKRNPDAFQPYLAGSLNNLGNRLSELGRRAEALEAAKEAMEAYRELAKKNPDAFQPDLAMSLSNLGNRLSELGRRAAALEAAKEAMEAYRALAKRNPDAFQPTLAMSLNNLGVRLSELGRREEALEATKEAVALRRELAKRNPDAFQPDLTASLNNLGGRLSELGRRQEALEAAKEAVEAYRELAKRERDAFQPHLAASLNNLGVMLSELGKREEALEATKEAMEAYRELAKKNPDAFQPDLAGSLNNLGNRLSKLGRSAEALEAVKEAMEAYRELAMRNPDAFQPELAGSLNNLGVRLSELGRREEALGAFEEALDTLWPFFKRLPAVAMRNVGIMIGGLLGAYADLHHPPPPGFQERIEEFMRLAGLDPH